MSDDIIIFHVPWQSGDHQSVCKVHLLPGDPRTMCHIIDADFHVSGKGVRKHGDVYDLETGCRMALTSAVKVLDKDLRAAIWSKYLEWFPAEKRTKPAPAVVVSQKEVDEFFDRFSKTFFGCSTLPTK